MSKMSPHGAPKLSWGNGQRQPTLSLHVLPDQIHPRTQSLGLPRRDTPESDPTVCGWDKPASDCLSSRPASSHRLVMDPSLSRPLTRSTHSNTGQGSGNGRVVHLYLGHKNQIFVITIVDRLTRCYLGFRVVWERTQAAIHEIVDEAPNAKHLARRSRCFSPCP